MLHRCFPLLSLLVHLYSSTVEAVLDRPAHDALASEHHDDYAAFLQRHVESKTVEPIERRARIPPVLILMAKQHSMAELPLAVSANINRTLNANKDLQLRWFGDGDCKKFLEEHEHLGLSEVFKQERRGSYRGDICRAAVLAVEGGFYQDVDVELRVPWQQIINNSTTFATAWSAGGKDILNALIAVTPGNPVMLRTIEEIKKWYANPTSTEEWMGPATMTRALEGLLRTECPDALSRTREAFEISCGSNAFRLYKEQRLQCPIDLRGAASTQLRECSPFDGLRYGLFQPGSENLIGWPRFAECADFGCDAGGWTVSEGTGK
jgi:mannosyltransferase OCH1-like enzyme